MSHNKKKRLLLIGYQGFAGIDSVSWSNAATRNLRDYDIVLVSAPHLTEDVLLQIDTNYTHSLKQRMFSYLESEGKIVILIAPEVEIPHHGSNLDWCPIPFSTVRESGKSIVEHSSEYSTYLKRMESWNFYIHLPDSVRLPFPHYDKDKTDILCSQEPFVTNRYEKVLSGRYQIELYDRFSQLLNQNETAIPTRCLGEVVLLPLIEGIPPEEALGAILREEIQYDPRTTVPSWAEEIPMPKALEIKSRIRESEELIKEERLRLAKLKRQSGEISAYRQLLYSSGFELEAVVEKSLKYLGAEIIPARYAQEEFIMLFEEKEYLIEVKGVGKSVSLTHLRQLNDYLMKYEEKSDGESKGILIGNAWRTQPPDQRDKGDKPVFPTNVVRHAEKQGISLLSTVELFYAVCRAMQNPESGPRALRELTSAEGVARLQAN